MLEDHFLLAEDLRKVLEDSGAEVVGPFSEAAPAIAAVDRRRPTCAVVDINLGSGASFVPAKALLARSVPVIFVTGYDADVIPPDLSPAVYLQKPASKDDILNAVETLCGRAGD